MDIKNKHVGTFIALIVGMILLVPAISTGSDAEPQYLLAHFPELPSGEARANIEATGAEILNYQGDGNYLVKVPGTFSEDSLLGILTDSISPYPESIKVNPELNGMTGIVPIRISLHQGEYTGPVVTELMTRGAMIEKIHDILTPYILCEIDASNILDIAALNQVSAIQPNPAPITLMNLITTDTYMGHDTAQAGGFTGSGMLAEVQDNGCDLLHPDLTNVDYTDGSVVADDHGTCTTGIVFGTGVGDIDAQGIAYQGIGVFADWYTGRTTSVQNLWNGDFNEGYAGNNGIVQSNSWSQGTCNGQYNSYTSEDDQAAFDYPHVLTCWAAANSNSGTAEGLISVDSAAKNVMCVGAIWHRDTATLSDDTYENNGVGNTPSRGPSADGRQKPDLAGCFDWIYTVDQRGAAGYSGTNYYNNFGGTSGATPEIAGSSVLAYEMYEENYFGNNPTNTMPYSSTIKALMIADAQQYPLTGTYSATRTCQGWGTPDMENMYNLGAEYHQFDEYPQAMSSGSTWTRQIYTDSTHPLKITLCWIDPAAPGTTGSARALRNNLDLKVTSPGSVVYYGNNGLWNSLYSVSGTGANHWSTSSSYRDDLNNVENVFIQNPQLGIWTIEVSGRTGDIAQGPQDFSLVSSGAMPPVSSQGTINIENDVYPREATVMMEVEDRDLNTDPYSVDTVNVNLKSNAEPAGETALLTETGANTNLFQGTKTISATDSAGVVWVNVADMVTATYNDADDGTGNPVVVTDTATVDGTPPAAPTALTVDHWGSTRILMNETRYMRGVVDEASVNGHTTFLLGTAQSATAQQAGSGNRGTVYGGIRVWQVDDVGTETEITSGSAVAVASTAATGLVNGTWVCPQMTLSPTDSIVIRVYQDNTGVLTTQVAEFTTEQLGATQLDAGTWTVQYYLLRLIVDRFEWGTTFYDSKISNFSWSIDDDPYDDNTMNWTHSGTGVNNYVVYRSDISSGPWDDSHIIGTVPVGTNTYIDSHKGQADATLWWYIVRSEDYLGNRDTNINAVQEPGYMPPYEINLSGKSANSWVFVSFPSLMSGSIQTILDDTVGWGDGGTTWTVAKWFNAQDKTDPWKTYRVGSTINDMPTLTNTMGVWLWITTNGGNQALTLNTWAPNSLTAININLYSGWNMVGYPSATDRLGSVTLPAQADYVSVWQTASPYIADMAPGAVTMSHGNAYWVHVTADCVWNVNP